MRNNVQEKKNRITEKKMDKKIIFSLLFFCFSFFLFPQVVRADSWGAAYGATMIDQMITTIKRQIEGAILGTLKMAATEVLNNKVMGLVGGGTGSQPLFITDFKEFLYQDPHEKVHLFMNDFFSMTTQGKASAANYRGEEFNAGIHGGDFSGYLINTAKSVTTERSVRKYNFDQFGGINGFSRGNLKAFNAFFSNPMNNPYGYSIEAQQMYQEQLKTEQTVAATKSLSRGFLPKEQGGRVMSPAATIEAAVTNVQNLGNNIIAAAENPGELVSGVILAMANKMVTNLIQRGVGEIQSKIQREIRNVDNKIYGAVKEATDEIGPGVQYMGNVDKNLKVIIKNTEAPPAPLPPDP